jgi:hypothetical protein
MLQLNKYNKCVNYFTSGAWGSMQSGSNLNLVCSLIAYWRGSVFNAQSQTYKAVHFGRTLLYT